VPALSTARYKYFQVPLTRTLGLVHSPAGAYRALARSKRLPQQGNILEHPTIERGVVNLDTVLFHHFLKLTVADRIRHILLSPGCHGRGSSWPHFGADRRRWRRVPNSGAYRHWLGVTSARGRPLATVDPLQLRSGVKRRLSFQANALP
jgi:hypothetical protein